ncbi:hypothetical protein [Nocardia sp. NPDC019395]|uniref:hypothetical protein n=1 Tax=Nocardia sp. NPDC019395 TaxID=3154686 RepID=UPI0034034385
MNYPPPPPPPLPPGSPGGPPPPRRGSGLAIAGYAVVGACLSIAVIGSVGFFVFLSVVESSDRTTDIAVGVSAVIGVLAAFGGGTALILRRTPAGKGMGMGLMIGWALVTICTAGFCTGVNPSMYSAAEVPALSGAL